MGKEPSFIEEMVRDLRYMISQRYPSKEVKLVELKTNDGVVKLHFSVGDSESIAIDMALA